MFFTALHVSVGVTSPWGSVHAEVSIWEYLLVTIIVEPTVV